MLLTVTTDDDRIFSVEIAESATVASLTQQLEALSGTPAAAQELWHHNQKLETSATLHASGVAANDLIVLQRREQPMPTQAGPASLDMEGIISQLRSNPHVVETLPPDLRTAFRNNDPRLPELLTRFVLQQAQQRQQASGGPTPAEIDAMNANEFDPEMQQRIAERIQQEAIQSNFESALEHSPEVFSEVFMLYVKMTVNGQPIKAFVDSGAQRCVMSQACAERVHIAHLIDKRFVGVAQGVGTTKIIGAIHAVPVNVGGQVVPMSIQVLESDNMDFLFGLDMLKRYRCSIDLAANCLRFGALDNVELTFLSEHELPDDARRRRGAPPASEMGASSASQAAGAAAAARAAAGNVTPGQVPGAVDNSARAAANVPIGINVGGGRAPPAPAAISAIAPRAAPSGDLEAKVTQLQGLGFSRPECVQALEACGGDVDQAAAMLFG